MKNHHNFINFTKAMRNPKNQHQRVTIRDYYYQREVSFKHMAKVAAYTLGGNIVTYFIIAIIIFSLEFYLGGNMVLVVTVGAVITLPVAVLLPSFPPYRYLYFLVPRLYSLADDIKMWHKKATKLILFSEPLRFLIGLLPFSFTKYGIITSPFTYFAYTFLYVYPTDNYEKIVVNKDLGFIDIAVFAFIYLVYFAVYEFFLLRKIKKYMVDQQEYLEGCRNEREKYYNYNKIKFYD